MFPSPATALQMHSLTDLRAYYTMDDTVWQAFVDCVGDPGEDIRLLAVLPPAVLTASLERAVLPDGARLTAIQAAHVGLVYNLARRILHVRDGGQWERWTEGSLFGDPEVRQQGAQVPPAPSTATERKLKNSQVLDQGDDGEFMVEGEDTRAKWLETHRRLTGGLPQPEEEPSLEQLSALARRIFQQDGPPYTDFGVFVPFGQRALRASRYRTYVQTPEGFTAKELPGPASFVQWRACYRVLKTALIMLDCVSLANLHAYEMHMEKITRLYPTAWHLVYSADDLARASHANRTRARILLDIRTGKTPPDGWDEGKPWDTVFKLIPMDEQFWQEQVHAPALAWVASGSRGLPKTPAEQHALVSMQGGLQAIHPSTEGNTFTSPPSSAKARREARKKRLRAEREELQTYRAKEDTPKGKGKQKGQPKQKCYGWNNGTGPCGTLPPGQQCASPVKRLHRCTICDSPGHPSRSCPQKKEDA